MGNDTTRATRRSILTAAASAGLLGGAGTTAASPLEEPIDDVLDTSMDVTADLADEFCSPDIETLASPLAFLPAIREPGERLRLELDSDVPVDHPDDVTVTIRPTFGDVQPEAVLEVLEVDAGRSDVWRDEGARNVTVVHAEAPALETEGRLTSGLYDVNVAWDGGDDGQPRALQLVESFPDEPTVYVVADSHAGDWRATVDAIPKAAEAGDPEPFLFRYEHNLGIGTDTETWNGFRRAVAEVSALDPDIVLFPGDLTFGQDVPGKYLQEYLDAYEILSELRAPVFTTPGNHDGIVQAPLDGLELYRRFIGPTDYSIDVRPGVRVTSVNTYDWGELDRTGATYAVSAWGGQVRDEQLARLRETLREWREDNPNGTHVAFGHHNPTWRQDDDSLLKAIGRGIPLLEQVTRGVVDIATGGQGWSGENRIELRELLDDVGTTAYFCGHSHQDRLSRLVDDGDVVYTPDDEGTVERMTRDDESVSDRYPREELVEQLLEGEGTLFVNSTTASSGTDQYWGWRRLELPDRTNALDPSTFGYPIHDDLLEEWAADPDDWPSEHVELGRYSHPTFELEVDEVDFDGLAALVVKNQSRQAHQGTLRMGLPDCESIDVEGGDILWRRRGDDDQEVAVAYEVDAEDVQYVRVDCEETSGGGRPPVPDRPAANESAAGDSTDEASSAEETRSDGSAETESSDDSSVLDDVDLLP